MNNGSVLSRGVVAGFLLVVVSVGFPPPATRPGCGEFQVGERLRTIIPTLSCRSSTPPVRAGGHLAGPRPGLRLAGSTPVLYPAVLVVSCLDNWASTVRSPAELHQPGSLARRWSSRSRRIISRPSTAVRAEQRLGPFCPSPGQGRPPRLREQRHALQHRLQPDYQHRRWHGDAADLALGVDQLWRPGLGCRRGHDLPGPAPLAR